MKNMTILFLLCIFPDFSYGETNVSFKNNSTGQLTCQILMNSNYVPFVRLDPGQRKVFNKFKLGSNARCSISIDSQSSTVLTYFHVNMTGEYEALKELVECTTCSNGINVRWATIIVYPNGQSVYNELK